MTKKNITPIDVLIGIAYHLPKGQRSYLHNSERFFRFFYEQRDKYPKLLGELRFDCDGLWPVSPDLEGALDTLFTARMLSYNTAQPTRNLFDEGACECYFERILSTLPRQTRNEMSVLSDEFRRYM